MKLAADARISSLLLLAVLVRASPESGSVVGTVFDPGGYPLSRASVHLSASNPERNYSGQTDINGRFRIDAVPPGDYKATISLQGFRSSTQNVRVNSGDATDVGAQQLAVGECNTPGGPICDDLYVSQPRRGRNVDRATQDACPNSMALGMLKHQIAYQRTEEYDPLRGLSVIHLDVWMRGPLTGFYILEPMSGAVPTIRDTYLIDEKDGLQGGGSCPLDKAGDHVSRDSRTLSQPELKRGPARRRSICAGSRHGSPPQTISKSGESLASFVMKLRIGGGRPRGLLCAIST